MKIGMLLLYVSLLWILSEIVLAILRRARDKGPNNKDKSSLLILWLTITICASAGYYLGYGGQA